MRYVIAILSLIFLSACSGNMVAPQCAPVSPVDHVGKSVFVDNPCNTWTTIHVEESGDPAMLIITASADPPLRYDPVQFVFPAETENPIRPENLVAVKVLDGNIWTLLMTRE